MKYRASFQRVWQAIRDESVLYMTDHGGMSHSIFARDMANNPKYDPSWRYHIAGQIDSQIYLSEETIVDTMRNGMRFLCEKPEEIPDMDDYEGMTRLPYPRCSFEFHILLGDGTRKHAYLYAQEIASLPTASPRWTHEMPQLADSDTPPLFVLVLIRDKGVIFQLPCWVGVNYREHPRIHKGIIVNTSHLETFGDSGTNICAVMLRFLGFINARGVKLRTVSRKQVKAKRQQRFKDHLEYRVIDPTMIISGGSDPTGLRQRYHLRRGHMRRLPDSQERRWIQHYFAGDPSLGVVVKDYQVEPQT